ncbi:ATP-binding cassette domain-containing protein [Clostridium sp. WILCCON 0269]|uniref:ATP-binding cassette domain-containing protein n=1 Tax=Candidatus Clostridium eludens TaxID=3381663 RepID=A0ABW8SKJ0_9CLOT
MVTEYEHNYEVIIKNLNKSYEGTPIFSDLSMNFIMGKITAVLGPSGCGKTTLLNIISGIETNYSGEVILKSKNISYVFQEDRLIPHLTVYENVAFVLKSTMSKINMDITANGFLDMVELLEYKDKLPDKLSGGMKRRVAFARAAAYKSNLILMDEPFKGLDERLKKSIIKKFLVHQRETGRTVILVTHDKIEAEIMGDIIYSLN